MVARREVLAGLGATAAAAVMPSTRARAAARVLSAPIAVEDGRVLMAVGLNGQGPFLFMIDTGGVVSLIRDDAAKRLKLPVIGRNVLGGAGGTDVFALYRADDVLLGNAWRQQTAVFAGAGDLRFAPDVIGSLAAGMLTTRDTDLDFDRRELRMYPDGRGARDGFTRVPSRIEHRGLENGSAYIFADAVLDGQSFRFVVDTGATQPLTLFASAARRTRLWDESRPFVPLRRSGLGGPGPLGRTVRAERLELGGVAIDRPLVMLAGASTGYALEDGIIGLPLLRRWNLSIDTRARALWMQPSRQPIAPERYPLSGIWLERHGDAVVVDAVGTASPAAQAGVRAGDRLVGLDLSGALRMLGAPAGNIVPLTIERGGTRHTLTLTLRPYL